MKPLSTGDPLRLGPYRLLGVLGEGGMGKVYVGQDAARHRRRREGPAPRTRSRPEPRPALRTRGAGGAGRDQQGVARVLGAQTEGGRPWIATEFLAGPTLDQAVEAHGPFEDAALRALPASLARTLADIHATGLIHRDLKPPNIVLTSDGPRVIDFGIARPEHGLTLTTTGQIPVTPGYGAPEQVLGQRVGPSADVFSLGAVLVYAASGKRAFEGGHVAAAAVRGRARRTPTGRAYPRHSGALIAPCLAKDPAARPTPAQIVDGFAPPRGAERVWKRGALASDIKARERSVKELTAVTTGVGTARPLARRRLLIGPDGGRRGRSPGAAAPGRGGCISKRSRDESLRFPARRRHPEGPPTVDADNGDYVTNESPPEAALETRAGAASGEPGGPARTGRRRLRPAWTTGSWPTTSSTASSAGRHRTCGWRAAICRSRTG